VGAPTDQQQQQHDPPTKSDLRLIQHVFLPTVLPSKNVDCEKQIDDELKLLSEFCECLNSFDIDKIDLTKGTFGVWNDVQENFDPQMVAERIKSMCPGESFAAYIRRQNCGLLITVLDPLGGEGTDGALIENGGGDCKPQNQWIKEQAAVSTFPVSLKSARVTGSPCGSFASVLPHVSVVIPKKDLLNSKALVRQLKDLCFFDMREAVSKAKKGGTELVESRNVTDPLYLSKWIVSVLSDKNSRASNGIEIPRVVKKIRDVVIFKEEIPWRRYGMWMAMKTVLQICLQKELGKKNGFLLYKAIILKFLTGFLNEARLKRCGAEDWLIAEMLAKIGRRVWKLEKVIKDEPVRRLNSVIINSILLCNL